MAISLATATKTTAYTNVVNNWDETVTSGVKLRLLVGATEVDYVILPSTDFSASSGTLVYTGSPILFTVAPSTTGVNGLILLGAKPSAAAFTETLFTYSFDATEYRDYPNGGTFSLPDITFTVTEE